MSANTKIEWCDHTFNPWVGCTKISPACDNCYAERWAKRCGQVQWGAGAKRRRTTVANWKHPLRWNRLAEIQFHAWEKFKETQPGLTDAQLIERGFTKPIRPRVFCASLADVFDNEVSREWRLDLIKLIADTPYLDWLLLTKRIGNADDMLEDVYGSWNTDPFRNVWIGATVCNQAEADRDIPKLLHVPAAAHFLSIEPMLEPIDLTGEYLAAKHNGKHPFPYLPKEYRTAFIDLLDWVIVGGESGPHARPMHPQWVRDIRDQCKTAGVPFLFKQWGEWATTYDREIDAPDWRACPKARNNKERYLNLAGGHGFHGDRVVFVKKVGKKSAGHLLDGVLHDEFPEELP